MKIKRTIEIEAEEKDLELLDKYEFYYKRNVEEMIKNVATQIREVIAMRKAENGRREEEKT